MRRKESSELEEKCSELEEECSKLEGESSESKVGAIPRPVG
jgi:hypothetical protein